LVSVSPCHMRKTLHSFGWV